LPERRRGQKDTKGIQLYQPKLGEFYANSRQVLPVDIGIEDENRKQIAQGFSSLADTYSLYLKTHYFHWNVTGSLFSLHQMFEEQYTELAMAVDTIAIRSLGYFALGLTASLQN